MRWRRGGGLKKGNLIEVRKLQLEGVCSTVGVHWNEHQERTSSLESGKRLSSIMEDISGSSHGNHSHGPERKVVGHIKRRKGKRGFY